MQNSANNIVPMQAVHFLFFDRTRPETFENIEEWLQALKTAAGDVPVVVIENKIDLDSALDENKIHEVVAKHVLRFVQTSAIENIQVEQAFTELVREIDDRLSK